MTKVTALMVFCTCPDKETAATLAEAAVSARVAACVNVLDGVGSVFAWDGHIDRANEVLLVAKTTESRYDALEQLWLSRHPYELPEIIAVPLAKGLAAYLQWITDSVTP